MPKLIRKCKDGKEASLYMDANGGVIAILKTQEETKMTPTQQQKTFWSQLILGAAVLTKTETHEITTESDLVKFKATFKFPESGCLGIVLSPESSISFDVTKGITWRVQTKKILGAVPIEVAQRIADKI